MIEVEEFLKLIHKDTYPHKGLLELWKLLMKKLMNTYSVSDNRDEMYEVNKAIILYPEFFFSYYKVRIFGYCKVIRKTYFLQKLLSRYVRNEPYIAGIFFDEYSKQETPKLKEK